MKMQVEELSSYKKLGKALKLSTDKAEVIIPLEIGPRIMHLSLPGQPSVIEDECPLEEALPDGQIYKFYGGHRTWHSPEAFPRSYMPDNEPLERYELLENGIKLYQKQEPWTQMKKSMELYFEDDGGIRIVNNITNNNAWAIEMAVWSLTIGSRSGREVLPVVQRNTGLQTNTGYRSWPYSRMDDPRAHWGQRYIVVDNDPTDETAFKIGYQNELGWMAYFNHGQCFVKKYQHQRKAKYSDEGCSYETYTSYWGVELETLSPLQIVKPGKTLSHEERWYVVASEGLPTYDEDEIAAKMAPIAAVAGIELPVNSGEGWDPNFVEEDD